MNSLRAILLYFFLITVIMLEISVAKGADTRLNLDVIGSGLDQKVGRIFDWSEWENTLRNNINLSFLQNIFDSKNNSTDENNSEKSGGAGETAKKITDKLILIFTTLKNLVWQKITEWGVYLLTIIGR